MKRLKTTITAILFLTVLLSVGCTTSTPQSQGASQGATTRGTGDASPDQQNSLTVHWPILPTTDNGSSADVDAVKNAIKKADTIEMYAALTFDLSHFPDVYADELTVPLSKAHMDFVQQVRAVQPSAVAVGMSGNGFLTYITSFYLNWKTGAEGWERAIARAAAEKRQVEKADIDAITGTVDTPLQGNNVHTVVSLETVRNQREYNFKQISIVGDQADVWYDDGRALTHVFLVKTSSGWKEAGLVRPNIHF